MNLFSVWIVAVAASILNAAPLACNMEQYRGAAGLTAKTSGAVLTVEWNGDPGQQVRLEFSIDHQTPLIRELALRAAGGRWSVAATNISPDFRVATGLRRISNQQLAPLRGLGVALTKEVIDKYRWDPFWDAPLDLSRPNGRGGNPPPAEGVADQPGLPRNPGEIQHASAEYHSSACAVKTDGARIEVSFPGVQLGVFNGTLQFTVFRGSNLIQMEILATTQHNWVAYKYDAGIGGLKGAIRWRDIHGMWQQHEPNGPSGDAVPLKTSGRVVIAESPAGSVALFPPPHNFFWAREIAVNLGYNWYRQDAGSLAIGIRQADHEDESQNQANFALYSARPGTLQHMTVFLYPNRGDAAATYDAALAFTHGDRYQPLPGYQVMNHHYHMDLGERLVAAGSVDAPIPDLVALKALGINIVSQIDSVGFGPDRAPGGAMYPGPHETAEIPGTGGGVRKRGDELAVRHAAIEGAHRHSSPGFLVMPDQEFYGSPLGGHTDLLFSHPVYWTYGRAASQPLVDQSPKYGKFYHIKSSDDLMAMVKAEDVMINMPHPRTKGSTGYPDSIKDLPFFNDPHYQGVGFRWGMGLDRSEVRLCEDRCLALLDDMNNWVADKPIPPKYIVSISEVRHQQPGDEIYSSSPVTYLKLGALPSGYDMSPIIHALEHGDSFVTSGEVLIRSYDVQGSGDQRKIVADLEWTFPLNFVEVVWGDGKTSSRQVISTTGLAPMGRHHFEIPFHAAGRKWVRFAAWDTAGDGAIAQPRKLQ